MTAKNPRNEKYFKKQKMKYVFVIIKKEKMVDEENVLVPKTLISFT